MQLMSIHNIPGERWVKLMTILLIMLLLLIMILLEQGKS